MKITKASAGLHKTSLALALLAALCVTSAPGASATSLSTNAFATVAQPTALHPGDAITGALPMTQPIHIEVALKMRDREGLDALIADNARNQANGIAPHLMSSAEFLATHAPTSAQAQAVANYLGSMGYTHITIAPNRLLVSADGTAATARNAFSTTLAQVKTHDGRIAFANTDALRIPVALQDKILAVIGLQTVHQMHTLSHPVTSDGVHTDLITGHNPTEFPAIYGGGSLAAASDVVVGMVTEGDLGHTKTDLATFASNAGLPAVSTLTVNTNGTSTDYSHTSEWDLGSEDLIGMAHQVQQLIFYKVPTLSHSDITADFNTIVAANKTKIILATVGECETTAQSDGSAAADDAIFATAVAQGQTFSVAAGDLGADECSDGGTKPLWPASSQYVVAVTGTTLDASTTTWNSETVYSGTGGSQSTFEPKPSWQTLWTGTFRGAADVAFDDDQASGAKIIVNGTQGQYGGSALSASLFAGAWAHVLHQYPGMGFAGPVIYALPSADFHDITSGSNGIPAGVGYDLASGRGSLILGSAITDMGNTSPQARWSYSQSGRTATFIDQSTDTNGAIAKYSWNFGDGSTNATTANPIHTYAADGMYSVKETVTDGAGATASRTQTAVVQAASGPVELFGNTGFETGTEAPWVMSTSAMLFNNKFGAHSGTWFVGIGTISSGQYDNLSQEVTIPSGKSSATLAFWVETGQGHVDNDDPMEVNVYSLANVKLAQLALYYSVNLPLTYGQKTLDMTPYIGQTVIVKFTRYNSPGGGGGLGEKPFSLDDITLTVQ